MRVLQVGVHVRAPAFWKSSWGLNSGPLIFGNFHAASGGPGVHSQSQMPKETRDSECSIEVQFGPPWSIQSQSWALSQNKPCRSDACSSTLTVRSKELEHGCIMVRAGVPSFGFGLEDGHVPTFWIPLKIKLPQLRPC